MPIIIIETFESDIENIIDKVEKTAKRVFGPNGIMPMKSGIVEIVPKPVNFVSLNEYIIIEILLHKEKDRTPELLKRIIKEFERISTKIAVRINPSPKKMVADNMKTLCLLFLSKNLQSKNLISIREILDEDYAIFPAVNDTNADPMEKRMENIFSVSGAVH